MILDLEKFLPYLDETALSHEEKVAFITNLWNYLDGFLTQDLKRRAIKSRGRSSVSNLQSPESVLDSSELQTQFTQSANDNQRLNKAESKYGTSD